MCVQGCGGDRRKQRNWLGDSEGAESARRESTLQTVYGGRKRDLLITINYLLVIRRCTCCAAASNAPTMPSRRWSRRDFEFSVYYYFRNVLRPAAPPLVSSSPSVICPSSWLFAHARSELLKVWTSLSLVRPVFEWNIVSKIDKKVTEILSNIGWQNLFLPVVRTNSEF